MNNKLIRALADVRAVLHLIAIVASAAVSALTALQVGGDPAVAAATGASLNAAVTVLAGVTHQ